MNKLKKALPFVLIALFVASVAVFAVNYGFKYSDYENSIKVTVSGDKDVDTFIDKLKDSTGLIELDRNNNTATYQHVDQTTVQDNLTNIQKDYPEVKTVVANIYTAVSKKEKVINILLSVCAILALFVGYSYVLKTRFYKWNLKEYVKYYGFYLLDNVVALGILAGVISILSLAYKVNDYILYSFFFLTFFKTLIFWFKLLNEDIHQMKLSYVENFKNDYKKLFTISFILIVLIGVGMGVKSVLPLALFAVSIVVSALTDYSVLTFEMPKLRRSLNNEIVTKSKPATVNAVPVKQYVPNPKLKKKNKKK